MNNEKFFETYKRLEKLVGASDGDSFYKKYSELAKNDRVLRDLKEKVLYLKDIRNFHAHNFKTDEFFSVNESSIKLLEKIIYHINNPITAYNISSKPVDGRNLSDNVLKTVQMMKKNKFSFIPIFNDKIFFGVFSSEVLFNYFNENGITLLDDKITFHDLKNYLPINKHVNEKFLFKSRNYTLNKIEAEFIESYKTDKVLSAIFVTENGKEKESIIGVITAWDVLSGYK
jgi:predicted transcriptional regulator